MPSSQKFLQSRLLYNSLADDVQLGGLATTPKETQAPTEAELQRH